MEIAGANNSLHTQMEAFLETALHDQLILDAVFAQQQDDRRQFWQIRERIDHILAEHSPVFTFDISLAVSEMEQYVATVDRELKQHFPVVNNYVFGHMGDGNLHFMINCGEGNEQAKELVEKILYAPLASIPSSVSAEHGIGIDKKKWLGFSKSQEEIAVMKSIKKCSIPTIS